MYLKKLILTTSISIALVLPAVGTASDASKAESLCKLKIMAKHGTDGKWKDIDHEKLGDDKYRVTGKRKQDGDMYEFTCKVKDNIVTKYDYDKVDDYEGLSDKQKAAAAAVLVTAAAVAAKKNQDDDGDLKDRLDGKSWRNGKELLKDKGYEKKKELEIAGVKVTYWWKGSSDSCLAVSRNDGEITKVSDKSASFCGE